MDNTKLNELAAKAMGWTMVNDRGATFYGRPTPLDPLFFRKWNPSTCADDALTLLEKVAGNEGIMLHKLKKRYGNWVCWLKSGANCRAFYEAKSMPLAMTLCALRAANIPESEITAAME